MTTANEGRPMTSLTAYKGFDKNMQCRGFQYAEGETYEHKAAGSIGYVLFLVERNPNDWAITAHASVMVDGDTIKADTFYTLRGGKVVEA